MSTNKKNISIDSGINLPPQTVAPAVSEGNIYNNSGDTTLHTYIAAADRKIITDTQTQTLTNKIHDGGVASATSQIILPAASTTTLNALTRKAAAVYYDSTVGAPKYDNGSALSLFSSASTSIEKNYFITNGANNNFALNVVTPWSVFNTTFSAAGVPGTITLTATNVTFATTATNPLLISSSSYNGQLVKTANNSQGQGIISTAMTIDREDLAKVIYGSFSYEAVSGTIDFSGTSTESFEIWIYNVTAATWIQPSGYRGMNQGTGQGKVVFNFQTDSTAANNSYQVAVILRQTDTNAMTVNFNDFTLGPRPLVLGAPMTDVVNAGVITIGAITTAPVKGTTSVDKVYWRREGQYAYIYYEYNQTATGSGTAGSGNYLFSLPSGLVMDTTIVTVNTTVNTVTENSTVIGYFNGQAAAGSQAGPAHAVPYSSTQFRLTGLYGAVANTVGSANWSLNNSTLTFGGWIKVPIVGWSSNVQMSSDTDTRVVSASAYCSTSQSASTTTPINFDTIEFDTHGAITTGASWNFKAPISGYYEVEVFAATATVSTITQIYKNTSAYKMSTFTNANLASNSGTTTLFLNSGDTIDVRPTAARTMTGGTLANTTGATSYISIKRVTGPSVITSTESVYASYYVSTATVSTSVTQPVNFDTKIVDSHGAVTTGSSWKFTAPISGLYEIGGHQSMTVSNSVVAYINGTANVAIADSDSNTAMSGFVKLNAGDALDIRNTSSGSARGGSITGHLVCIITIKRVGN